MVLGPKQRYYELDFSPLHDSRGVPVGYLLLIRDVTAQKETQAQILEQQRTLAVLNDREQVARELHDELSQELAFINTQAQAVAHSLAAGQTTQAEARLQRLAQVAREVQVDVRGQINKLSFTVSPGDGLLGALRQFLEAYKRVFDIPAELVLNEALPEIVLEPIAEMQLLRITQEAFTNIRKHAHAQHVRVYLDRQDQAVELSIEDDGVGFDPRQRKADSPTFGLGIMADRAKEIGASFQVSSRCGQGTRVTVRVPATPIKKGSSG